MATSTRAGARTASGSTCVPPPAAGVSGVPYSSSCHADTAAPIETSAAAPAPAIVLVRPDCGPVVASRRSPARRVAGDPEHAGADEDDGDGDHPERLTRAFNPDGDSGDGEDADRPGHPDHGPDPRDGGRLPAVEAAIRDGAAPRDHQEFDLRRSNRRTAAAPVRPVPAPRSRRAPASARAARRRARRGDRAPAARTAAAVRRCRRTPSRGVHPFAARSRSP